MTIGKLSLFAFCGSTLLFAQTQTQIDALRSYLQSIQNKAAVSLATIDSPARPGNWKELVDADAVAVQSLAGETRSTLSQVTTRSTSVPAGTNLQYVIDAAQPGDTLILQAGVEYRGNFILPVKTGTGVITITSSRLVDMPEGQRVTPAKRVAMPRIVSPNGAPAIASARGAHHYRIVGVEITSVPGTYSNGVVELGAGNETTAAMQPYEIELDRVYIHGDPTVGSKRGVAVNGRALTVRNSWISDFKSNFQDTQAICGWNGPGPITIANNYLEATGENILFGGAEPALAGVTPSDINITGNHLNHPVIWRGVWPVKNLLELKTGRRVMISGNIIENNWSSGQAGYAIVLKPGAENVRTRAITTNVTMTNNIIRHATGGVNILSRNTTGGYVSNVIIRNNLFEDLGEKWGHPVSLFTILSGGSGFTFENNTLTSETLRTVLTFDGAYPANNLVMRSNILSRGDYGIKGSGTAEGTATLTRYAPGSTVTHNVFYGLGLISSAYPPSNYFVTSLAQVGWESLSIVRLLSTSTYRGTGADGKDPGVDYTALLAATAKTLAGK